MRSIIYIYAVNSIADDNNGTFWRQQQPSTTSDSSTTHVVSDMVGVGNTQLCILCVYKRLFIIMNISLAGVIFFVNFINFGK